MGLEPYAIRGPGCLHLQPADGTQHVVPMLRSVLLNPHVRQGDQMLPNNPSGHAHSNAGNLSSQDKLLLDSPVSKLACLYLSR